MPSILQRYVSAWPFRSIKTTGSVIQSPYSKALNGLNGQPAGGPKVKTTIKGLV
jgi:hypothetical protein